MTADPIFVLVDGSSYLFRAFHGLPKLTSRAGEPTGALQGVINMLNRLHDDYQPTHIAVVFDAPGKTFRHDLFAEYKGHRPPMDDDLRVQIQPLLDLIQAIGFPLLSIEGVEADDVIGTLARLATEAHYDVLISSGDKDLTQLVNANVKLVDTMKSEVTDYHNIGNRFKLDTDLRPDQVVDFLALVGDTADNIPGIPKCGPKTAGKWLATYDNIDNLLAHKEDIKGKIGENLRANLDQLALSRALTKIKTDVALDINIEHLSMNTPDFDAVNALCNRFDLTKIRDRIFKEHEESPQNEEPTSVDITYLCLENPNTINETLPSLTKLTCFALVDRDLPPNVETPNLAGLAFANRAGNALFVPFSDDVLAQCHDAIQTALDNTILTHDHKSLRHRLARYNFNCAHTLDDIMLASYCYNSTTIQHDLDIIAFKYGQHKPVSVEQIVGKGAKRQAFSQIDVEAQSEFACERVDWLYRCGQYLLPRIDAMPGLMTVYYQIELPTSQCLYTAEKHGALLDVDFLKQESDALSKKINDAENDAFAIAGEAFNLGSPKQLQTILFEQLDLPIIKKTPKGQPSTDEEVLTQLADTHALPRLILTHRSLTKLKTTYTDKLPDTVAGDGRVHTNYRQAVTSTGRLSSQDPNLQNIPIRMPEGRRIRQAFIAPRNYQLLACDYSQIELRIMAHLSQDAGLLKAFNEGLDIHRQTASEIFDVELDDVDFDQRRNAKAINFGLIYGMSAFGLAKQIGVDRSDAAKYIDQYFEKFPGVKRYMTDIAQYAKTLGFVETLFGRRLHLPDIDSKNAVRRHAAERLAINAPMQGTAADIIKIAMKNVINHLGDADDVRIILQVHDELVFEVHNDTAKRRKIEICKWMRDAVSLDVPLLVESSLGKNWDEAH